MESSGSLVFNMDDLIRANSFKIKPKGKNKNIKICRVPEGLVLFHGTNSTNVDWEYVKNNAFYSTSILIPFRIVDEAKKETPNEMELRPRVLEYVVTQEFYVVIYKVEYKHPFVGEIVDSETGKTYNIIGRATILGTWGDEEIEIAPNFPTKDYMRLVRSFRFYGDEETYFKYVKLFCDSHLYSGPLQLARIYDRVQNKTFYGNVRAQFTLPDYPQPERNTRDKYKHTHSYLQNLGGYATKIFGTKNGQYYQPTLYNGTIFQSFAPEGKTIIQLNKPDMYAYYNFMRQMERENNHKGLCTLYPIVSTAGNRYNIKLEDISQFKRRGNDTCYLDYFWFNNEEFKVSAERNKQTIKISEYQIANSCTIYEETSRIVAPKILKSIINGASRPIDQNVTRKQTLFSSQNDEDLILDTRTASLSALFSARFIKSDNSMCLYVNGFSIMDESGKNETEKNAIELSMLKIFEALIISVSDLGRECRVFIPHYLTKLVFERLPILCICTHSFRGYFVEYCIIPSLFWKCCEKVRLRDLPLFSKEIMHNLSIYCNIPILESKLSFSSPNILIMNNGNGTLCKHVEVEEKEFMTKLIAELNERREHLVKYKSGSIVGNLLDEFMLKSRSPNEENFIMFLCNNGFYSLIQSCFETFPSLLELLHYAYPDILNNILVHLFAKANELLFCNHYVSKQFCIISTLHIDQVGGEVETTEEQNTEQWVRFMETRFCIIAILKQLGEYFQNRRTMSDSLFVSQFSSIFTTNIKHYGNLELLRHFVKKFKKPETIEDMRVAYCNRDNNLRQAFSELYGAVFPILSVNCCRFTYNEGMCRFLVEFWLLSLEKFISLLEQLAASGCPADELEIEGCMERFYTSVKEVVSSVKFVSEKNDEEYEGYSPAGFLTAKEMMAGYLSEFYERAYHDTQGINLLIYHDDSQQMKKPEYFLDNILQLMAFDSQNLYEREEFWASIITNRHQKYDLEGEAITKTFETLVLNHDYSKMRAVYRFCDMYFTKSEGGFVRSLQLTDKAKTNVFEDFMDDSEIFEKGSVYLTQLLEHIFLLISDKRGQEKEAPTWMYNIDSLLRSVLARKHPLNVDKAIYEDNLAGFFDLFIHLAEKEVSKFQRKISDFMNFNPVQFEFTHCYKLYDIDCFNIACHQNYPKIIELIVYYFNVNPYAHLGFLNSLNGSCYNSIRKSNPKASLDIEGYCLHTSCYNLRDSYCAVMYKIINFSVIEMSVQQMIFTRSDWHKYSDPILEIFNPKGLITIQEAMDRYCLSRDSCGYDLYGLAAKVPSNKVPPIVENTLSEDTSKKRKRSSVYTLRKTWLVDSREVLLLAILTLGSRNAILNKRKKKEEEPTIERKNEKDINNFLFGFRNEFHISSMS